MKKSGKRINLIYSIAHFARKSQHEIRLLISGPGAYICDACVELCNESIREKIEDDSSLETLKS